MRGYAFNSTADFEVVREIKEQCCFISYDRHKDRKLAEETTLLDKEFKLPDGNKKCTYSLQYFPIILPGLHVVVVYHVIIVAYGYFFFLFFLL